MATAEFDALGRRIKKAVEDSGDPDGTVVYLYDGQKIIETRDGSENLYQQFIHGTRYIDELVMVRVKDKGDLYVHQAERDQGGSVKDWNVIGLTDLGGSLVERSVYRPYVEVTVNQETGYGDRDGDVDATDKGTPNRGTPSILFGTKFAKVGGEGRSVAKWRGMWIPSDGLAGICAANGAQHQRPTQHRLNRLSILGDQFFDVA